MQYFSFITGNRILDVSIIAWIAAQVIKLFITAILDHKWEFRRVLESGGMPSSHSAMVTACATAVGRVCGTDSPIFAVAVVFALIVMYDASNVRRAAGEQAKILNYMMINWDKTTPEMFQKELKEFLGHTPVQVVAGAALGIILGLFA